MIQPGDEPIPGYRLEHLLGRGQYGEVWRATTPGRSSIALKFLDLTGRQGRKEFRSAQRVKQIRHAHLMPIVAIWMLDKDGNVLTDDAMESLSDEESASLKTIALGATADAVVPAKMVIATPLGDLDLRDRMEQCQGEGLPGIPNAELVDYMQEAAKGLDYLNSEQHDWRGSSVGVQHCDIKPDNIMLVGGSVVICDFGVAQVMADYGGDIRATSLSGSPAFMAPEAFEAKPSRTSDQYSLAVTYYELRTGELPLYGESFAEVYDAHRSGKLDFSLIPEREQAVLRRATSLDPKRRYASSGEFVQELRKAAFDPIPEKKKFSLVWLGVLAGLLLIAVSLGAFSMLFWQERDVKLKLHFDAPDTHVVVNEKEYMADKDGMLDIKAAINEPLNISVAGSEFRKPMQWTIAASELVKKKSFEFSLPFNAAYHAAEGERLLVKGKIEDAAEAYALAIKEDAPGYARFPEPTSLEIPAIVWGDCFQVTPNGEWLVAGGKDGTVRRWKIGSTGIDPETQELYKHENAQVTNLVATDKLVASACDLGSVWISHNGDARELEKGSGTETDLAVTGDGNWLVAAVSAELATKLLAWDINSPQIAGSRLAIGEQPGEFPRLVMAADDSVALATIDDDAMVWRWKVRQADHEELGRQQNEVLTLSASTDGRTIAYAGVANSSGETPEAAIVEVETKTVYRLASRQSDSIQASALDDDGRLLVTAERMGGFDETGTVIVWQPNVASGIATTDRALQYDKELGDVSALVASHEAQWIAAGHEQGAVTLWYGKDSSATPLLTFGAGDRVVALRITPDERWLISGARDGRVLIFDLQRLDMLRRACERAGVTPKIGEDKVTLRDQPGKRALRFPWAYGETSCPLPARPNA